MYPASFGAFWSMCQNDIRPCDVSKNDIVRGKICFCITTKVHQRVLDDKVNPEDLHVYLAFLKKQSPMTSGSY